MKANISTRAFATQPKTWNEQSRTLEAVVATEQPAKVYDFERFDIVNEVLLMSGAVVPDQVPLLDSHNRDRVSDILGHCRNFKREGDTLTAEVVLVDGPEGEAVSRRIAGGHLTDLSVGYRVDASEWIHDGETRSMGNQTFTGPLRVTTAWTVKEVSLTPVGADDRAKFRSLHMEDNSQTTIVKAERERCKAINEACAPFGLHEIAAHHIAQGSAVEEARSAVLAHLAKTNPPLNSFAIDAGPTSDEKRRAAVIDALCLRSGVAIEKPAPGHENFRAVRVMDIAMDSLRSSGQRHQGLSGAEIVKRAMTTSDFPSLLSGYSNKVLRQAYENAPGTFDKWTVEGSADDFKELRRVQLSEAPDLAVVAENAEYTLGTMADGAEVFQIAKHGKILRQSWESLVNDDLQAFSRKARAFVQAAKRGLNYAVYSKLSGSDTMSDDVAIFHETSHGNLAGTGGALDIDTLHAARLAMRSQVGMNSTYPLNIEPYALIVPAALETEAAALINTPAGFDVSTGVGVSNPFFKALELIVDPALDAFSTTAWYVVANPRQFDTIEIAYLDGMKMPYIEEETDFDTDAVSMKIRFSYGIGCLDYRGLYKNEGASG